jgi:hypothetical protein
MLAPFSFWILNSISHYAPLVLQILSDKKTTADQSRLLFSGTDVHKGFTKKIITFGRNKHILIIP